MNGAIKKRLKPYVLGEVVYAWDHPPVPRRHPGGNRQY
jgi:hypothetical protein